MHTGHVRYLPSICKNVVLGLVRREFRWSEVPTMVGSSDMYREFRHLKYSNSVAMVFKYAEGREFRRKSGVPMVGSSDIHREFRRLTN